MMNDVDLVQQWFQLDLLAEKTFCICNQDIHQENSTDPEVHAEQQGIKLQTEDNMRLQSKPGFHILDPAC